MTVRRLSLIVAALAAVLSVAALVRQARDPNGENLAWGRGDPRVDGWWDVVSLGGAKLAGSPDPRAGFDLSMRGGRLSWSLGCNEHQGLYRVARSEIYFRPGISTTAGCPVPDPLEGVLSGGPWSFRREKGRLVIQTISGPLVLRPAAFCDPGERRYGDPLRCG